MANVFIHFEPVGPVGEELEIDPDLPIYIKRGEDGYEKRVEYIEENEYLLLFLTIFSFLFF